MTGEFEWGCKEIEALLGRVRPKTRAVVQRVLDGSCIEIYGVLGIGLRWR